MKQRYNFTLDEIYREKLREMAKWVNRSDSNMLEQAIDREHSFQKSLQDKKEARRES